MIAGAWSMTPSLRGDVKYVQHLWGRYTWMLHLRQVLAPDLLLVFYIKSWVENTTL